jgi:hypothetical protein
MGKRMTDDSVPVKRTSLDAEAVENDPARYPAWLGYQVNARIWKMIIGF